jgi:hypothetical protein
MKMTIMAIVIMFSSPLAAQIITVDDDGPADFNTLQDALAAASSGDEIRVAQGIYKPDQGAGVTGGDRTATFQLKNGIALKGGYAGFGQPDPNIRNVETYVTILSGDLDGNDVDLNEPWDLHRDMTRAENSFSVVTGSGTDSSSILDGFTITAGHANDLLAEPNSPANNGGGMYNQSGSPTVINCKFLKNTAKVIWSSVRIAGGGGMFNLNSSPSLHNCKFIEDIIFTGEVISAGGGMFNVNSNPTLVNCLFSGNVATGFDSDYIGGGMCNYNSNPSLVDCSFADNLAYRGGGGIFNDYNSTATLTGCTFRDNWGHYLGGAMFSERSTLILNTCVFQDNAATYGGGIHNDRDCCSTISNCTFTANEAGRGGGMYNFYASSTIASNCNFVDNRASEGGGIYNASGASVTLTSCTLARNRAAFGAGMYNYACSPILNNCILWGDTPDEIHAEGNTPVITYSDVQGGWPGEGNIDVDPCFVAPGYWDSNGTPGDSNDDYWVDGDYRLKSEGGRWEANSESWVLDEVTSACIDKGDWMSPIGDEPYPNGGSINMGAYGGTAEASKSPVISCWEAGECAGQRYGDATCDGNAALADLYALKAAFGSSAPWTDPQCCADFNHDGSVNLGDLFILKGNYGTTGSSPSTLNQDCPP